MSLSSNARTSQDPPDQIELADATDEPDIMVRHTAGEGEARRQLVP